MAQGPISALRYHREDRIAFYCTDVESQVGNTFTNLT